MQEFPAFFYHPVHARAGYLFKSQEQLDSAGEGWVNTPAAFGVVTHPPEQVPGVLQPPVVVSPAPVAVETPTETEPPAETAPVATPAVEPVAEEEDKTPPPAPPETEGESIPVKPVANKQGRPRGRKKVY